MYVGDPDRKYDMLRQGQMRLQFSGILCTLCGIESYYSNLAVPIRGVPL
jgi:hypothetical protein